MTKNLHKYMKRIKQLFCKHLSTAGVTYSNKDKIEWCNDCGKILKLKVAYMEKSLKNKSI